MPQPLVKIKVIRGIDNLSDNANLNPTSRGIYLREADNVDIDDEGMPHRRDGDSELVVSTTTAHSFWSDGEIALFVDGTVFKKFNADETTTNLVTGLDPTDKMAYVSKNGIVYFSNHTIVGYVQNGLSYAFPDPAQTFKTRMVGGQCLEIHYNRLYAAHDCNLFFSDATILTRMDQRKNAIAFHGYITMLKSVLDGLYVSAEDGVYFLKGSDPISNIVQMKVLDDPAREGTAVIVEDDDIGRGALGRAVYWTGEDGTVYKGYPGGIVIQCQNGLFEMTDLDAGTAILKSDHGYSQYVVICPLKPGIGGANGSITIPRISETGTD